MKNQYSRLNDKILILANNPKIMETLKKFPTNFDWNRLELFSNSFFCPKLEDFPKEFCKFNWGKLSTNTISSFVFYDVNGVSFQFSHDIAFWLDSIQTNGIIFQYKELSTIIDVVNKDNLLAFL